MSLLSKVQDLSEGYFEEALKHRRHLHANPELSFEEENTAKYVQEVLQQNGINYKANVAGHGVVGIIEGKNPTKKVIALRGEQKKALCMPVVTMHILLHF